MAKFITILAFIAIFVGCAQRITIIKARYKSSESMISDPKNQPYSSRPTYDNYLNDGLILFRQGDSRGACRLFECAIDIDSINWRAYYYLGLTLSSEGEYDLARNSFNSSLAQAPNDKRTRSLIYLALAESWEKQGELGQAELNYITALNLYPNSSPATDGLRRIGQLRQKVGK